MDETRVGEWAGWTVWCSDENWAGLRVWMKDESSDGAKVDLSGERMVAAMAAKRVVSMVSPQVETKDGHLGETWARKLV